MLVHPPVFVIADGMGGHRAGDVASSIVVKRFDALAAEEHIDTDSVDVCIRECQEAVAALSDSPEDAPGSTVVSAAYVVVHDRGYWLIANVGDSRAYVWEAGALEQLSHDHSVVQELVDSGQIDEEQARSHPERHVITRAIGALEDSVAEYALVPVRSGSRLLLCSDGLTSELADPLIGAVLANQEDTQAAVQELVDAAVFAGGRDNVTVMVIDVLGSREANEDTLGSAQHAVNEDTIRGSRR